MKYTKRLVAFALVGSLITTTNSCSEKQPSIQLIHSSELNFPSASAIEYYQNKLYVFGDDATSLLILSPGYHVLDSIGFWGLQNKRISKEEKHDIESAMIMAEHGEPVLFGVGSMSADKRWSVFKYNFKNNSIYKTSFFEIGMSFTGIVAINIEGSCMVNNIIVLSNRANLSNPVNYLLFRENNDSITVKKFILPSAERVAGVSGLYYVKEKDMLLFTASEEETPNAIADGAIGDSYLGWIENFSEKMKEAEFKPTQFLRLGDADSAFTKQKIESVCVEQIESDNLILHLVADNDKGTSRLFKLKLRF